MDDREKQVLFLKRLKETAGKAAENGNKITEEELKEAFADLELDEKQMTQVRDFLKSKGVGIGEPLPLEEVISEEEMNHLKEYEEMIDSIEIPSDNVMDAIKLSAMAGERDAQQRLTEYSLRKVVDIARLYAGQEVFMEDLIGAGNEALLIAVTQLAPLEKPDEVDGYLGRRIMDAMEDLIAMNLDEKAAELLFPGVEPIGSTVDLLGEPFIVVGLIRKADNFQPVIESLRDYETYTGDEYGIVLIPDADWPILYNYDEPQDCVARAVSTEKMSDVGRQVEQIMKKSVGGSGTGEDAVTYKAEDLLEKARNKQELANSTNNLLIWIASIALLVGGIGVMNIMLVSVTERTNEIGLKKALGARNSRILTQFLTEAVVLTSLGGVAGVISGIILAEVISRAAGTPVAISIPAIILSVLFSMAIGVIFGFLPSVQAANLNPIDALRRE